MNRKSSIGLALGLVGAVLAAGTAHAQTDARQDALLALTVLAEVENLDAAVYLGERLTDTSISEHDWKSLFADYFQEGIFTYGHWSFWEYVLDNTSGSVQTRAAQISAIWASEAIAHALAGGADGVTLDSLTNGFRWLATIAQPLGPNGRAAAFETIKSSIGDRTMEWMAVNRDVFPLYLQCAMTLRDYAPPDPGSRAVVARLLGLRDSAKVFWDAHRVFLFDGGAFTADHIGALAHVYQVIPAELHLIGAFVVPDGYGIDPSSYPLVSMSQAVYLPVLPLNATTSPDEFREWVAQPIAPLFTVTVAQQIVRAIQQIQFARRPELAARRDVILLNARDVPERYLRRHEIVSPATYLANPEIFLPSIAWLYFIDSEAAYALAASFCELDRGEPMDSFLLVADLMSGGRDDTVFYTTNADGTFSYTRSQIGRTTVTIVPPDGSGIPVSLSYCNALEFDGLHHVFAYDAYGSAADVTVY